MHQISGNDMHMLFGRTTRSTKTRTNGKYKQAMESLDEYQIFLLRLLAFTLSTLRIMTLVSQAIIVPRPSVLVLFGIQMPERMDPVPFCLWRCIFLFGYNTLVTQRMRLLLLLLMVNIRPQLFSNSGVDPVGHYLLLRHARTVFLNYYVPGSFLIIHFIIHFNNACFER